MSSNETQNTASTPGTVEAPDAVRGQKAAAAAGTPAAVDAGNADAASAQAGKKAQPETPQEKSNVKTAISDEVIIEFDHVTKTYNLYKNDRARFLDIFGMCPDSLSLGSVNANNNLSFKIRRGEAVAFLGSNGAGKSTCLKMITGVTYPTSGEIHVNGRVSALLELKAGFDKNLTGRENIHLRGQVMGLTEEEIEKIEPEVVKFAALGVLYRPALPYVFQRYEVAFGLRIRRQRRSRESSIIDEALSVGDRKFKRKCIKRIRKIMTDENVTVLFVTHSTGAAREFCSRGIVLDHGSKVFDGDIDEAIALYDEMNK